MNVTDLAKGIRKLQSLNKELSDIEFKEQILELRGLLVEAQEELLNREVENMNLNQKIVEFEEAISFSATLVDVDGWMYRANENGSPYGYPYCPKCLTGSNKFYQIVDPRGIPLSRCCPNCGFVYGKSAKRILAPNEK